MGVKALTTFWVTVVYISTYFVLRQNDILMIHINIMMEASILPYIVMFTK